MYSEMYWFLPFLGILAVAQGLTSEEKYDAEIHDYYTEIFEDTVKSRGNAPKEDDDVPVARSYPVPFQSYSLPKPLPYPVNRLIPHPLPIRIGRPVPVPIPVPVPSQPVHIPVPVPHPVPVPVPVPHPYPVIQCVGKHGKYKVCGCRKHCAHHKRHHQPHPHQPVISLPMFPYHKPIPVPVPVPEPTLAYLDNPDYPHYPNYPAPPPLTRLDPLATKVHTTCCRLQLSHCTPVCLKKE